jgi:hypothetical protein
VRELIKLGHAPVSVEDDRWRRMFRDMQSAAREARRSIDAAGEKSLKALAPTLRELADCAPPCSDESFAKTPADWAALARLYASRCEAALLASDGAQAEGVS